MSAPITGYTELDLIGFTDKGPFNPNATYFKNDLVFEFKDTGKNLLIYTEDQEPVEIIDYLGNKLILYDKSGCCILPTTYVLGKSQEYEHLLSDESARRAIYKENL